MLDKDVKTCSKCKETKSTSEFNKNRSKRDGLEYYCKSCRKEHLKEYREANREVILEKQKEYYEANREVILEYKKEYREANREVIREYKKEYREANREVIREKDKEYYKANREAVLEYKKEYYEANREARREYSRARHQENPEINGLRGYCERTGIKAKDLYHKYGLTREELLEETRPFYREARRLTEETGEPHEVDHIIPLASGGEHRAYNLQVLTAAENRSKWHKLDQ